MGSSCGQTRANYCCMFQVRLLVFLSHLSDSLMMADIWCLAGQTIVSDSTHQKLVNIRQFFFKSHTFKLENEGQISKTRYARHFYISDNRERLPPIHTKLQKNVIVRKVGRGGSQLCNWQRGCDLPGSGQTGDVGGWGRWLCHSLVSTNFLQC